MKNVLISLLNRRHQQVWLLNDTFAVDMAAGTLNGTPASGGPGVRTVVDTENKLSVAGGVLSFAGGKASPAWGDPGLCYGEVTRVAGRVLLALFNGGAISNLIPLAWSNTTVLGLPTVTSSNGFEIPIAGTGLRVRDVASSFVIGTIADNTLYALALVLRESGAFYFIKNGEYTAWTLVWIATTPSTASQFPSISNYNGIFTAAIPRIPAQLWLPSALASDSFTRANGALGSTDGMGHAEQNGGNGLTWQYDSGVWTVAGNVAVGTPTLGSELVVNGGFDADTDWEKGAGWTIAAGVATHTGATSAMYQDVSAITEMWYQILCDVVSYTSGSFAVNIGGLVYGKPRTATGNHIDVIRNTGNTYVYAVGNELEGSIGNYSVLQLTLSSLFASVTVSTPDVLAEAAVTLTVGTQAGLVLNLDSAATPANFVIAYHDGTNCLLEKCVAGTYTTVISAAATYSAGAVLRVIKDGTAYRLYYNNALVGTGTISDAGIVSNARHGLFSTYAGNSFDNFVVWARGTGGEYSALDSF